LTTQTSTPIQKTVSSWCSSTTKRGLDIAVALVALIALGPLMLLIAFAIKATSQGPVLFRQRRCGLIGNGFELLKFRTMDNRPPHSGPGVTRRGDPRVTSLGKWLRRWKLDELPQLINVLHGEMSIVGPRPDLEDFWRQATEAERQVLAVKPGLTSAATLVFCNEEELLARVPESELVGFYVRDLLPRKARLDCEYAAQADFLSDCRILFKTVAAIFSPSLTQTRTGR
jgi:lipopolysaccharide/colanic/teichoic acid biosynthesis glycosyltransferase